MRTTALALALLLLGVAPARADDPPWRIPLDAPKVVERPRPRTLVVGLGAAASFEVRAAQPTLGMPLVSLALERTLGGTGLYIAAHVEIAWWLMYHARNQAGGLLGFQLALADERWWLYGAVGAGYAAVSRMDGDFGHGPYARFELGVKRRLAPAAQTSWRLEVRVGLALQATSLTYDTQQGALDGWRIDPALLCAGSLRF